MKNNFLLYILKHYIFWLLIFFVNRSVFLLYNYSKVAETALIDVFRTFSYGIYLDNSAIAYILLLPLILILLQSFFNKKIFSISLFVYTALFIVVNSIITSAELPLFDDWGVKINYKALSYLANPSEVIGTATWSDTFLSISLITTQIVSFLWIYKKCIFQKEITNIGNKWIVNPILFLLMAFVLVFGLRGGLQPIPINQSDVYFSKFDIINTTAVNSSWNLLHSINQNRKYLNENPYQYYDLEEAKKVVNEIQKVKKDTTTIILKTNRPNVVLLILESWSSDCVNGIDGYFEGIAPFYDSIASDGILFTKCYGSGFRSDQGMVAIYSGFPAQPNTSIIKQPNKFSKLPCINSEFKKAGYQTSFMFGGQLNYGNIKGYMYFNGFDKITEQADFSDEVPAGNLGVHDEFMLQQFHKDINSFKEPFFASAFTCSSHSPFDHPEIKNSVTFGDDENDYYNSVKYSDQSLKQFFENIKNEPWYDNTLFVLVADHSHATSKHWGRRTSAYKKIPMLFYGNVIKDEFKGIPYSKLCAQTDLPKTLMKQLDMNSDDLFWSNDLYNPTRNQYAFHTFNDGVGWITPSGIYGYDHTLNAVIEKNIWVKGAEPRLEKEAKSYLQVLYEEYLAY